MGRRLSLYSVNPLPSVVFVAGSVPIVVVHLGQPVLRNLPPSATTLDNILNVSYSTCQCFVDSIIVEGASMRCWAMRCFYNPKVWA